MRIYFNTSALNRPFDDLSSRRVRLEAEAIVALLGAVESDLVEWVGSDYLDFEISQDPDPERVRRVRSLAELARRRVEVSGAVTDRARSLERAGLRGLDALHVASAEAGEAELLITTDDRMLRRSRRAGLALAVRVVTPVEAVELIPRRTQR